MAVFCVCVTEVTSCRGREKHKRNPPFPCVPRVRLISRGQVNTVPVPKGLHRICMSGKDAAALLPPAGRIQGIFSLHDGKTFISRKNRLCGFFKKGIRQPEVFCPPPAPGFRRMKKRKTALCLPERQRWVFSKFAKDSLKTLLSQVSGYTDILHSVLRRTK